MINLNNDKDFFNTDYDIIILAGQSNAVGHGKGDFTYKKDDRAKIMYRYRESHLPRPAFMRNTLYFETLAPRKDWLYKSYGLHLSFAEQYLKNNLEDGRKLLIWRSAVGGTGFSDKRWGLHDDLYSDTVSTAKQLLRGNGNNRIKAVLWHQGETDIMHNIDKDNYYKYLYNLICGIRKELSLPSLPFIAGGMVQDWLKNQKGAENVVQASHKVISDLPFTGFADSAGLNGNNGNDVIHYDNPSLFELGKRYYDIYVKLTK